MTAKGAGINIETRPCFLLFVVESEHYFCRNPELFFRHDASIIMLMVKNIFFIGKFVLLKLPWRFEIYNTRTSSTR